MVIHSNRVAKFLKGLWFAVAILLSAVALMLGYSRAFMRRDIALRAMKDPHVTRALQKQLGDPIHVGYFISGKVFAECCDHGSADLDIPVSGPEDQGTLNVWSQDRFVGWRICSAYYKPRYGAGIVIVPDNSCNDRE